MIRISARYHEPILGAITTEVPAVVLHCEAADRHSPSFLPSPPAITLAGVNDLWELHRISLDSHGWSVLGVGLLAGSISSFIAVWGLLGSDADTGTVLVVALGLVPRRHRQLPSDAVDPRRISVAIALKAIGPNMQRRGGAATV